MGLGAAFNGFIDGYEGSRRANAEAERAAAAREDQAYQQELRARQRDQFAREDDARGLFQSQGAKLLAGMNAQRPDVVEDFRRDNKLMPTGVVYDPVSDTSMRTTPQAAEGGLTPNPALQPGQTKAADYYQQAKDSLKMAAEVALKSNDHKGFYSASKDIGNLNISADAARLQASIISMPDQEFKSMMESVSNDKRNGLKVTFDENGVPKLKDGDISVPMNKEQAAVYFSAKHRLNAGDGSALADMAKIHEGLAAREEARYKASFDFVAKDTEAKQKLSHEIALENIKGGNKDHQIRLEKGMEGGNAIALENTKQLAPRQLPQGTTLSIPQKNKDGSITYVTAAENKAPKAAAAASDAQMSSIAIANYGTLDPGTGRMAGNQKTGRIAAAARAIQQANPGLDANQAIEAAAREINKPAGAP